MKSYSWAMMARKAAGEKVVQCGNESWMTEDKATAIGAQVVPHPCGGTWVTASYARERQQRSDTLAEQEKQAELQRQAELQKQAELQRQAGIQKQAEAQLPTFDFLKLLPELRLRVLALLIGNTRLPVFTRNRHGPHTGMVLPPIAYASKAIRAEFLKVVIEGTTFSIHNGDGNTKFQQWLAGLDLRVVSSYTDGLDAVKALDFPFFSRFPHALSAPHEPNNDMKLMQKCKELETVSMCFAAEELVDYNDPTSFAKSTPRLRAEYRLDGLLQLRKLKALRLSQFGYGGLADGVLQDLAEWVRKTLEMANGEAIEVVVV